MFDENVPTSKIQRALLCVDAATAQELAGRSVFGQPVLFHQIRLLESLGVNEVAIAVETIPAEYPGLVERLRAQGLQVSLLRGGAEVAAFGEASGLCLVQDAAIWAGPDILSSVLGTGAPEVAVLQEEPGWAAFERIDLNRRWAGFAIIDAALLKNSSGLPEGWSLGSFLMRSALQAGYGDAVIEGQPGKILLHRVSTAKQADLEILARPKHATGGVAEAALYHVADKGLSVLGRHSWYRPLSLWSGFAAAACAFFSSIFDYISVGYILIFLSVIGLYWRRHTQSFEYRTERAIWPDACAMAVLLATIAILLSSETSMADALFHSAVAAAMLWLVNRNQGSRLGAELSPVAIMLAVLGGHFAALALWTVKLAIAAMVVALLMSPKLNPN